MARIGDDTLFVRGEQRPDASWLFTVRYVVQFERPEVGLRFADSVCVSADCCACPVPFLACGPAVLRKKRVVIDGAMLTDLSEHDNVYVIVHLRCRGGAGTEIQSARLRRISAHSLGARPRGPGTVWSTGRLCGAVAAGSL